jgi:hypothetical protein
VSTSGYDRCGHILAFCNLMVDGQCEIWIYLTNADDMLTGLRRCRRGSVLPSNTSV